MAAEKTQAEQRFANDLAWLKSQKVLPGDLFTPTFNPNHGFFKAIGGFGGVNIKLEEFRIYLPRESARALKEAITDLILKRYEEKPSYKLRVLNPFRWVISVWPEYCLRLMPFYPIFRLYMRNVESLLSDKRLCEELWRDNRMIRVKPDFKRLNIPKETAEMVGIKRNKTCWIGTREEIDSRGYGTGFRWIEIWEPKVRKIWLAGQKEKLLNELERPRLRIAPELPSPAP